MAITKLQLEDLGFKKLRRKQFDSSHTTYLLPLNKNDYLFTGYDKITNKTNFKIIWISRLVNEFGRITQPVSTMGEASYFKLKEYIEDLKRIDRLKEDAGSN